MNAAIALHNLDGCIAHLKQLKERLKAEKGVTAPESERSERLQAILDFAQDGCELTKLAVERGAWPYEFVHARPITESAFRLYYAAVVPDGWEKYSRYWLEQDIERVKLFIDSAPDGHDTGNMQKTLDNLLAQKAKNPNQIPMPYKLPSLMDATMREENNQTAAAGGKADTDEERKKDIQLIHSMWFKTSHTYSHGHPDYLLNSFQAKQGEVEPQNFRGILHVQAVFLLSKAVYRLRGWPNAHEDATDWANALYHSQPHKRQ